MVIDDKIIKEQKQELVAIEKNINERWEQGKYEQKWQRIAEIQNITAEPDFWSDQNRAKEILSEEKSLKSLIEPWRDLRSQVKDTMELLALAEEENDRDTMQEVLNDIQKLSVEFNRLESRSLLDQEDDKNNTYLTIHPGAGGTESQDWAEMLMRMYLRWADASDFKVQILDSTPGEQAGIKSFTVLISGENAYGMMKCENGVHRLVRISPFDSQKRRHTSFASVYATPEVDDAIEVDINEEELRIDTYRSSGAGGQHVNTTDSAVRITHIPSGIVVQCQNERSQHKNKATAMKMLKSALYQLEKQKKEEELKEKESEKKEIAWGSQIRSYVFHPYNMVKDHRTNFESGNVQAMMDGELLDDFVYAFLKAKNLGQI